MGIEEFENSGYIQVGFAPDYSSVRQLEELLNKYMLPVVEMRNNRKKDEKNQQNAEKNEKDKNKRDEQQAKLQLEYQKRIEQELKRIQKSYYDADTKMRETLNQQAKMSDGWKILIKFAKGITDGLVTTYKNGEKWALALNNVDRAGIATTHGFDELYKASSKAGMGFENFSKIAIAHNKTIIKLNSVVDSGIEKFGEIMSGLDNQYNFSKEEQAKLVDSFISQQQSMQAINDPKFKDNLNNYVKQMAILRTVTGETVDNMIAEKKSKDTRLAIQAWDATHTAVAENLNQSKVFSNFSSDVQANFKGVATVGNSELAMMRQDPIFRAVEPVIREAIRKNNVNPVELDKFVSKYMKKTDYRTRIKKITESDIQNAALVSKPLSQMYYSMIPTMDLDKTDYDDAENSVSENNITNKTLRGSREFAQIMASIINDKDYILSGGNSAFLAMLQTVTKSASGVKNLTNKAGNSLADKSIEIANQNKLYGKENIGIIAGEAIINGFGKQMLTALADGLELGFSKVLNKISGGDSSEGGGSGGIWNGIKDTVLGYLIYDKGKNAGKSSMPNKPKNKWLKRLGLLGMIYDGYNLHEDISSGNYLDATKDTIKMALWKNPVSGVIGELADIVGGIGGEKLVDKFNWGRYSDEEKAEMTKRVLENRDKFFSSQNIVNTPANSEIYYNNMMSNATRNAYNEREVERIKNSQIVELLEKSCKEQGRCANYLERMSYDNKSKSNQKVF